MSTFFPLGLPPYAEGLSGTAVEVLDLPTVTIGGASDTDLKGFYDGFASGNYGYVVPYDNGAKFGKVARFDLATFAVVEVLDLTATPGQTDLKGFAGGFASGGYGYVVPNDNGAKFGKVARFNLTTFNVTSVEVLDLPAVTPVGAGASDTDLKGFKGGFLSGGYGYVVPYDNGAKFGKVVRFDLATFSVVEVLDLESSDTDLKGFYGGFASGGYGYVLPNNNGAKFGKVARFNLTTFNVASVEVLDLTATPGQTDLKGFAGGFASGGYGYVVPNDNGAKFGKVARFNLTTFNVTSVEVLDLQAVTPVGAGASDTDLKGFEGGFASGGYGYVVPYDNGAKFGKVVRFDLATFSVVEVLDLESSDTDLKGFLGGFASGGYGYVVPYYNGAKFGKVARFGIGPNEGGFIA